ncbi:GNAT family N-acetyltransferase [Microbacterium sp. H1-D42]|uniref:GNAT family N-acetyltransferase n=1 Tax=Microbacterium sp. H1-D42 TaxID=2925844 RepID=UPI001F53CCD4|nr:GNAT family N-acetyltransferase [Microbacterium sp. H1-D42]UNK72084.1 GNAT family N-acetyltransferase [Microbacterium sp. H1-D42]
MDMIWRMTESEPERGERIARARDRVWAKRHQAEKTETAPVTIEDGELWIGEDADGREVIALWVRHEGPHSFLADVHAPQLGADELWSAVSALAAAEKWPRVTFSAFLGDDSAAALAVASDASRIATKMQRETSDAPMPQGVATMPMTEGEYAGYAARSDRSYAEELLASGSVADMDAALAEAAAAMGRLLPDGLQTPDQRLWTVRDPEDETVGILWVHLQAERAFIYDIEMREEARGRGYGTQALRAAAAHAREAGRELIALNVFGQNEGARRLYTREGYVATEIIWTVTCD